VTGYTTDGWGDLFVAAAGATAALSGLIFVAISVNIGPVLEADKRTGQNFLTGRALEALVALLNVLAISLVGLRRSLVARSRRSSSSLPQNRPSRRSGLLASAAASRQWIPSRSCAWSRRLR
jgi:hypothetical protein